MAARMVWLVANGMVRPDRVLGLTFTRKAAAEFADRVRSRLERLRRAGPLNTELPGTDKPGTAGTEDPSAKTYTPFSLKVTRADGSQPLRSLEMTLPKGLVGKLAGIPYCSDSALASAAGKSGRSEQSSSSCPSASQVGSVNVGAGAGSTPLYVGGKAYLAGPYKGAPLSLAIITPAVAGPFDLGTVVVRAKLDVNPENAQIHAVSDELPTILQGIPLNIRSVALKMDRPEFTLNPTSCEPMKVEGSALYKLKPGDFRGAHTGWMNSPGHRANILRTSPAGGPTQIGVGIVVRGGSFWATQNFARP
jgi:hypothetical protein